MTSLDACLQLSPDVALRPEPFGALAYHFGNRRLTFLKRPELVSLVRELDGTRPLRDVLMDLNISERGWSAYVQALTRLAEADMVRVVQPEAHNG